MARAWHCWFRQQDVSVSTFCERARPMRLLEEKRPVQEAEETCRRTEAAAAPNREPAYEVAEAEAGGRAGPLVEAAAGGKARRVKSKAK